MAGMNSSVLTCNHVLSAAGSVGSTAHDAKKVSSCSSATMGGGGHKVAMPVMRAQVEEQKPGSVVDGRRAAMMCFGGALLATALGASSASASVIDDYLEKSKANKELNDKKRLVTSGANFARAYTVQFGSCKFPFNFTGCQDLAKQKKVPFISDDLDLECQGKDKYKCGSNVFWKW